MVSFTEGLLRTLCFHDGWGYAPTRVELFHGWDAGFSPPYQGGARGGLLGSAFDELLLQNRIVERRGRIVFPGREALIEEHEARERLFPRKIRRARRVARWLARIDGVRFVALCNTTALAHAREEGDLDFFVITGQGHLWQTRAWGALPFKLFGQRPSPHAEKSDAVCLSFFVDDAALNLEACQLPGDDVYFRHWFLSLLPLYDDGVSRSLWEANAALRARHPFAQPWLVSPDLGIKRPHLRVPTPKIFEAWAEKGQRAALPASIKASMNVDSRVIVNEHVLKFHVEDGRERYRDRYQINCRTYGVEA